MLRLNRATWAALIITSLPACEGPRGQKGQDGAPGSPGAKGGSCSVQQANYTVICEDGSAAYVRGTDGDPGQPGEKGDKGDKGDTGATGSKGDKGDTGATGSKGDKGDPGATGSPGASGIIWMDSVSGNGPDPSGTLQFLVTPLTVAVTEQGQRVHVVSSRHLGSSSPAGADGLELWICYQIGDGAIGQNGAGAWLGKVLPNMMVSWSLSAVLKNLPPAIYKVGLCGKTTGAHPNWNWNEYGYTSAIVGKL